MGGGTAIRVLALINPGTPASPGISTDPQASLRRSHKRSALPAWQALRQKSAHLPCHRQHREAGHKASPGGPARLTRFVSPCAWRTAIGISSRTRHRRRAANSHFVSLTVACVATAPSSAAAPPKATTRATATIHSNQGEFMLRPSGCRALILGVSRRLANTDGKNASRDVQLRTVNPHKRTAAVGPSPQRHVEVQAAGHHPVGTAASNCWAYVVRGACSSSSVGPCSTTRPDCITSTSSAMKRTTAKSCVMKT